MMKGITARFVLLIAAAAVAPLLVYGLASFIQLSKATEQSVSNGNRGIARQAADQIADYIESNQRVLESIGAQLRTTGLAPWQQSQVLKNAVLDFREFSELSIFDVAGAPLATSRFGQPTVRIPKAASPSQLTFIAPIREDNDGLPTTTIAVRFTAGDLVAGWVVGELALEQLWHMVDKIKVGSRGRAALFSETNRLLAHGDPNKKRLVAIATGVSGLETTAATLRDKPETLAIYYDETGEEMLAVAALIPSLNWTVLVEQPTGEAYDVANKLRDQLLGVIAVALLATLIVGTLWGRTFLTRIFALTKATRAIAEGRLDERVAIAGNDELHQLGDAFNSMADSIVQLQDDVRKQERQAMFGRIAAGLVHDLSVPIQSIGNSCKLMQRLFDDGEYRDTFKRTVDHDMVAIKRVLDDLRNVARPIPLERQPLEVDLSLADVVESMQPHAELAGVSLRTALGAPGGIIEGDLFALGRVYRNLIINAIQATAPGGLVTVATTASRERVRVTVSDTGCGIPADRLTAIFEDYITTKRRGLGLGLAISKKIVEQLGGRISVSSEVGKGTAFVLDFPAASTTLGARPAPPHLQPFA